jgi:hypothetical protein
VTGASRQQADETGRWQCLSIYLFLLCLVYCMQLTTVQSVQGGWKCFLLIR